MDNSTITVVVQGPVQSTKGRPQDEGITRRCLKSVRENIPGAKITLSTWKNQDFRGLDFDELIVNEDPGPNIRGYKPDGTPFFENTNRQIVSTVGGLRRVETKYSMKLRSDNFLIGNGFKDLQKKYVGRCEEFRILSERVVVTNTLSRKYYRGRRVIFFLSDFFNFGLNEDLVNIWDLQLFDDFPFDPSLKGITQYNGAPWPAPDVDQILAQRFINKNRSKRLEIRHAFDKSSGSTIESDIFLANNFVVATPLEIGLGLPSKFTQGRQAKASSQASCIASPEWQRLYRRYCDASFQPPSAGLALLQIKLLRLIFVPIKALGNTFRLLREKLRYRRISKRLKFKE